MGAVDLTAKPIVLRHLQAPYDDDDGDGDGDGDGGFPGDGDGDGEEDRVALVVWTGGRGAITVAIGVEGDVEASVADAAGA